MAYNGNYSYINIQIAHSHENIIGIAIVNQFNVGIKSKVMVNGWKNLNKLEHTALQEEYAKINCKNEHSAMSAKIPMERMFSLVYNINNYPKRMRKTWSTADIVISEYILLKRLILRN